MIKHLSGMIVVMVLVVSPMLSEDQPTADEIIQKMFEKYAACKSYQDTGQVTTEFFTENGNYTQAKPFKTWFARPDLFRFEWKARHSERSPYKTYMIWHDGERAYSYWEPDRYQPCDSLANAVAGATGVSSVSAFTIVNMLIDDVKGHRIGEHESLSVVGDEIIEGTMCWILGGKSTRGNLVKYWIEKEDHLLRKTGDKTQLKDFYTESETIRHDIVIDEKIEKEQFSFDPGIPLDEKAARESREMMKRMEKWVESKGGKDNVSDDELAEWMKNNSGGSKKLKAAEARANTLGKIGSLESAAAIYYGDTEGNWPSTLDILVGPYIESIPKEEITGSNNVVTEYDGKGGWVYNSTNGTVLLNVEGKDEKGRAYSNYGY